MSASSPLRPIAVIGLGRIGGPVAGWLLRSGWQVNGYDPRIGRPRVTDRGIIYAGSAGAAVRKSQEVVIAVATADQLERTLTSDDGILTNASSGTPIYLLSTISLADYFRLADLTARNSMVLIDAPVTGGVKAAERGELVCLVGARADALSRAQRTLSAFTSKTIHAGSPGAGLVVKLACNLITLSSMIVARDALDLVEKSGIDWTVLAEAVEARETVTDGAARYVRRLVEEASASNLSDADSGAATEISLALKDLRAAHELGESLDGLECASAAFAIRNIQRAYG